MASFPLATTERGFTKRDGTQIPDSTEWHNIVAWRGLAKLAESYIVKGTQLYVEGKLRTRTYDDQNGVKKYITEIVADTVQLLGRKGDNPATQSAGTPVSSGNTTPNSAPVDNNTTQTSNSTPFESDDSSEDDLPF